MYGILLTLSGIAVVAALAGVYLGLSYLVAKKRAISATTSRELAKLSYSRNHTAMARLLNTALSQDEVVPFLPDEIRGKATELVEDFYRS